MKETGQFLEQLRSVTTMGALLIAHSIDPTATDNSRHLAYHKRNEEAGRYKGEVRIRLEYDGAVSPWFDLSLFEQPVLEALARDHGWQPEHAFPTHNGYYLLARRAD